MIKGGLRPEEKEGWAGEEEIGGGGGVGGGRGEIMLFLGWFHLKKKTKNGMIRVYRLAFCDYPMQYVAPAGKYKSSNFDNTGFNT